ncbi:hypothetical protein VCPCS023_001015B, partial [Vibrio cholerae O1 str. PCS-023]
FLVVLLLICSLELIKHRKSILLLARTQNLPIMRPH